MKHCETSLTTVDMVGRERCHNCPASGPSSVNKRLELLIEPLQECCSALPDMSCLYCALWVSCCYTQQWCEWWSLLHYYTTWQILVPSSFQCYSSTVYHLQYAVSVSCIF